jgi:protein-disulfide isomerase
MVGGRALVVACAALVAAPAMAEPPPRKIVTVVHNPPAEVPSVGSQNAAVTIEFFVNLGDGRTASVDRLLLTLHERHPHRLRILYRLVAQGEQSNAHLEAAQEAFLQGRFRPFVDALHDKGRVARASELVEVATAAGVDARRVQEALDDGRHADEILANHFYKKRRRIRRLPGLLINGEPYDRGQPRSIEELEALYDEAYDRSKQLLAEGVEPSRLYQRLLEEVAAAEPDPIIGPGAVDGLAPGERPPLGPPQVVSVRPAGHARGREDAPVPLVFFCNFQTRNCASLAQTLEEIAAAYPTEVRLVFRHFYDPSDRRQSEAAVFGAAARCADAQGRFWSYYELAYRQARQGQVPTDLTEEVARALELDTAAFGKCLARRATRAAVRAERAAARKAGIRHTPSIVLGGRLYTGTKSFEELSALVDRELQPGVLGRISPD